MSVQDLKDLFKLRLAKPKQKNFGKLPENQTLFWDSSNLGSYVKDPIRNALLNPATAGIRPTVRNK